MRYLYTFFYCLALILLCFLLTALLDKLFPVAAPFTHNLLSLVQLIILLTAINGLVLGSFTTVEKNYKKLLLLIACCIMLPELLLTYWLHHPEKIPNRLRSSFRYYYSESGRNIIQFDPQYSIYNSNLFYTLKRSARFTYSDYEFSDSFVTNSLGLRDDENSLIKPEIICLGDSYAMGWGVQQDETFTELLGKQSGYKALNAAVSSYGTARELKNYYRLDTSNVKYLIIQYCKNDLEENKSYTGSNYNLHISPENVYRSATGLHYWNKYWFPGKHLVSFLKLNTRRKLHSITHSAENPTADPSKTDTQQAALIFTDILARSAIDFSKVKVFVVDLDGKEMLNNDLIDQVNAITRSPGYKNHFNNNLIMVPVTDLLTESDYYILDPHLRPSGHRKIAGRLYKLIAASR
ncbi:MAG TPA: hypothetical protein PKC54_07085 [Ferruginibacter sp.]|nr:hypothetical protein [Ferruginibacter sp.]